MSDLVHGLIIFQLDVWWLHRVAHDFGIEATLIDVDYIEN